MNQHSQRKWTRLRDYDYSTNGMYFLTICTKDRAQILSRIQKDSNDQYVVVLSEIGKITEDIIQGIPGIEKYVIMPNHVHMIVHKTNGKPIASDIRSFKGLVTKRAGKPVWQKSYYDHRPRRDASPDASADMYCSMEQRTDEGIRPYGNGGK